MKEIIKIIAANLKNKTLDDIKRDYFDYLKVDDLINADKYDFIVNQKQSLMSQAFKNKYIKSPIYKGSHGKPLADSIYFNISHCDDYVVLILSNKYQVGIDIEKVKTDINKDLINYVCSKEEIESIKTSKDFYELWTKKEATLKLIGLGLTNNLKDALKNNNFYLKTYEIDDYVCSIAIDTKDINNIEIVKEKEYE